MKRLAGGLLLAAAVATAQAQTAARPIELRIAASGAATLPWVHEVRERFVPQVNERVAAAGGPRIVWSENYGSAAPPIEDAFEAVQAGHIDIGLVFVLVEGDRLPLSQVFTKTPFLTDRIEIVLEVVNDINARLPALRGEWARQRLVFLGAWGVDSYHLFTRQPVIRLEDLKGRRIAAPGSLGAWLGGTGAKHVEGTLRTFFTDAARGEIDGAVTTATAGLDIRLHEILSQVTIVNLGALYTGALAVNLRTWQRLPPVVQAALRAAGQDYSRKVAELVSERSRMSLARIAEDGERQRLGVRVKALAPAERERWQKAMPNIAAQWMGTRGVDPQAARTVLAAYMDGLRERGVRPGRDWDRELRPD